jgi:hypothetical protein
MGRKRISPFKKGPVICIILIPVQTKAIHRSLNQMQKSQNTHVLFLALSNKVNDRNTRSPIPRHNKNKLEATDYRNRAGF